MKKVAAVVLAVGAVVSMSACGAGLKEDGTNSAVKTFVVQFPDNSRVDCLLFDAHSSAGLECAYGKDSIATDTNNNLIGSFQSIAGEKVRCVTYDWTKEGAMDCDM